MQPGSFGIQSSSDVFRAILPSPEPPSVLRAASTSVTRSFDFSDALSECRFSAQRSLKGVRYPRSGGLISRGRYRSALRCLGVGRGRRSRMAKSVSQLANPRAADHEHHRRSRESGNQECDDNGNLARRRKELDSNRAGVLHKEVHQSNAEDDAKDQGHPGPADPRWLMGRARGRTFGGRSRRSLG
jgi:hypothetical protein